MVLGIELADGTLIDIVASHYFKVREVLAESLPRLFEELLRIFRELSQIARV